MQADSPRPSPLPRQAGGDLPALLRAARDGGFAASTVPRAVLMLRLEALVDFVQHLVGVVVSEDVVCPVERAVVCLQRTDVPQRALEKMLRALDINVR